VELFSFLLSNVNFLSSMNFLFNYLNSILKRKLLQELEGISMYPSDIESRTLDEYKQLEMQLHLELMNTCRKYISQLDVVSIMGILDIVKQEAIELEGAARKNIKKDEIEKN